MDGLENSSPLDTQAPQFAPNPQPPPAAVKPLREPADTTTPQADNQPASPPPAQDSSLPPPTDKQAAQPDEGFTPVKPIAAPDDGFTPVSGKEPPLFNDSQVKAHIDANLEAHFDSSHGVLSGSAAKPITAPGILSASQAHPEAGPEEADSWLKVVEAGLQISTAGLGIRGKRPDLVVPPDAGMFTRLLGNSATFAGDVPAMAYGAATGALLGSEIPVVGTVGGAFAGANAMPAALRRAMMDSFDKGSVKDFGDFWERTGGVMLDAAKAGAVGYATSLVGGNSALQTAVAQAGAMTIMGKALEGHMPKPEDFVDSLLFVGALHYGTQGISSIPDVPSRLRNVFAETAMRPEEVTYAAQNNPVLKTELFSDIVNHQKIMEEATGQPPGTFDHIDPTTGKPKPPEPIATEATGPAAQTRTEFEKTGEDYLHGTSRSFDRFDAEATNRYGGRVGDKFYFTDKPGVADTFANSSGFQQVSFPEYADKNQIDIGDKDALAEYRDSVDRAIEKGRLLVKSDPDGKLVHVKDSSELTDDDLYDGDVRLYSKGRAPRVIQTKVYGKTLDLTNPENIPDDLRARLQQEGRYRPWESGLPNFEHEYSSELTRYARENGYGKIKVNDAHESGFQSTIGLPEYIGLGRDAHREFVESALKEGKKVPSSVLADYPDLQLPPSSVPLGNANSTELSPATKTILAKIGEKGVSVKEPLFNADKFRQEVIDRFDPIKRATEYLADGQNLPITQDPYALFRSANDAPAKTLEFLTGRTFDPITLKTIGNGEPLDAIRKDLEGAGLRQDILGGYMASKRVANLLENGVTKTGFDPEAAKAFVEEHGKAYEPFATRMTAWREAATQAAVSYNLLSPEAFKTFQSNDNAYIDFRRLTEGGETTLLSAGSKPSSFKQLKGVLDDSVKTQNPLVAAVDSVSSIMRLGEINRAKLALADLIDKHNEGIDPDEQLIRKVAQTTSVKFSPEQMQKWMSENGLKGEPAAFEGWVRQFQAQLPDNQGGVLREGKLQVYEGPEDVMRAWKALDGDTASQSLVFRLASRITSIAKIGYTATPDFGVKHFERALILGNSFPDVPQTGFAETFSAMKELMGKSSDDYHNFLTSGGASGSFIDVTERYVDKYIDQLQEKTNFLSSAYNMLLSPIKKVEEMTQLYDLSVRFAKYKKLAGGSTDTETIAEGGWAARNATVDYTKIGAMHSANNLLFNNATTSFLNLHIQSMDKMYQAMKDDPIGFTRQAATWITAPTVLLYWLNHGNQRMEDEDQAQKDMYWRINLPFSLVGGRDVTYRQSIPPVLGLPFKVIPERIMDAFFAANPHAWKGFDETMIRMMAPTFMPDAVRPLAEQFVNKKFYTGGPVVSAGLEKVLPQFQSQEYTSETAKQIGKLLAVIPGVRDIGTKDAKISSPQVIDNYIQNWSGSVGNYAVQLIDEALRRSNIVTDRRAAYTIFDTPFVKSFLVREPSMNASPIHDFKERFGEGEKVMNSIKLLTKQGNLDQAQQFMSENQDKLTGLSQINETINRSAQAIQGISDLPVKDKNGNPLYSRDDKRQQIDSLTYYAIESAKQGMKMLDAMDAAAAQTKRKPGLGLGSVPGIPNSGAPQP